MPITCPSRPLMISILLLCSSATVAFADPPLRVGRLSDVEGTVSFHAVGQDQWTLAGLNYPVTTGDTLWTEPNARSEIQVGSIELRMDQSTEVDVVELNDRGTRVEVPQGVINVHVAADPLGGSVAVMTPVGEIDLVQPGTYHIDSGHPNGDIPSNQVSVSALEGHVQIRGQRATLDVLPGETAIISGNPPNYSFQEAVATPFDDWALAREQREMASQSLRYVSPHMTGYRDLDHYGQWSQDPAYGAVWYPASVAQNWAPYRYGHWAFVEPWGWTWVDNAPWGFAPFHYGRWIQAGPRWGWVPGEMAERPVYAPALVAFIGGTNWNASLSAGNASPAIGWVPLAPREAFYPYYASSADYVRNVNITNVRGTQINNIISVRNITVNNYANQQAATVVPATAFTQGAPAYRSQMRVAHAQLTQAPAMTSLAHLQPQSVAITGGNALPPAAISDMPRANLAQRVEGIAASTTAPINSLPQQSVQAHTENVLQSPSMVQQRTIATPAPHPAFNAAQHKPENAELEERGAPRVPAHVPGPPIHRPSAAVVQPHVPHPAERVMPATIPHPVQHVPITPTPKGWQRLPAEHAPKPQAQQEAPRSDKKREEEKKEHQ